MSRISNPALVTCSNLPVSQVHFSSGAFKCSDEHGSTRVRPPVLHIMKKGDAAPLSASNFQLIPSCVQRAGNNPKPRGERFFTLRMPLDLQAPPGGTRAGACGRAQYLDAPRSVAESPPRGASHRSRGSARRRGCGGRKEFKAPPGIT